MIRLLLPTMGRFFADVTPIQARLAVTDTVVAPTPTLGSVLTSVAPSSQIPAGQPGNPFSLDYLTQAAQSSIGILSGLFALLSLALLLGGGYYYFVGRNRWRLHRLNFRLAGFWSLVATVLGGLGVLFTVFRLLGIDGLNARFWFYLLLVVALGFAIYAAYYFRLRYPAELAKYMATLKPRKAASLAGGAARSAARSATPRSGRAVPPDSTTVVRPTGSAGNPRGTSERGERRREKK